MAGKAKRNPIPKDEPSGATFKRLAENRTGKALKAIALIANVARYDHSDAQAEKIVGALTAEVQRVKASFSGSGPRTEARFTL